MSDPLDFEPAPTRNRVTGWTAERQRRFIEAIWLGMTHGEAAARVGLSRRSAYALSAKPGGEGFAAAWTAAAEGAHRIGALERSGLARVTGLDGLLQPQFHRGKFVGFTVREDDRQILMRLARHGWSQNTQK